MKASLLLVAAILITASLWLMTGCKYDVTEPLWDKPYTAPPSPSITQINPASEVLPGINMITIQGTNFVVPPDTTIVYFNNVQADIVSVSSTSITVRRPNITADSCTIKVVPLRAYLEAKYSPYKVDLVMEEYGAFHDNLELAVTAVDENENVYVVEASSYKIHKVDPTGNKVDFGTAGRTPTDAIIGPDGDLYLLSNVANNRYIDKVNTATGEVANWTRLPQGRIAKFGIFDQEYLYAGGIRSGIFIAPFNDPSNVTATNYHKSEEILAIRINNNFLYVVARTGTSPAVIWKHPITSPGNIGDQELVFDMSTLDSTLSSRSISSIEFSSDGKIYIATYDPDPILVLDPSTSQIDYFYKGIVPAYARFSSWGTKNYLYIVSGNTSPAQTWDVFRLNMGVASAQN